MNFDFKNVKTDILDLIKNKKEVTKYTDYKSGGIYLIYIDNFNSEKIIPAYIGMTHNFQERHKEHIKEILSINRLSKKYYTYAITHKYYEGYYKSCKIFKYLVDNDCTLRNLHMIILEENDDEEKRIKLENFYIDRYMTTYFGFNQLNTISLQQDYLSGGSLSSIYLNCVEKDIQSVDNCINYGFNRFNYQLAHGLFERYNNDALSKMKNRIDFVNLLKLINEKDEFILEKKKTNNYISYTSKRDCELLSNEIIDNYFQKNNLKSEDKKKQIIKYLLFENESDKEEIVRYINRFSNNKNENIFESIIKDKGIEISKIKSKIKEYQEKNVEYNKKINELLLLIYTDIIPSKEYTSHPLKDFIVDKNLSLPDEENVLVLNIDVSNHGRRTMSDDYPCILKVNYLYKNNKKTINKEFYIKSSFDNFFEDEDEYYINRNLYNLHAEPFNISKYSKSRNYDTISTSMEYFNGINEITLIGKEKYKFIDVVNEIDKLINTDTKIIFTSGNKNYVGKYKEILNESLLFSKMNFHNREEKRKKIYFRKSKENELENLKYELYKKIKKDDKFKLCKNKELRINYIKDLLKSSLDDKYSLLKELWLSNAPSGVYKDAIKFIELVWKDIKENS